MTEEISVPRWILEEIENTLRIQNNIRLEKIRKSGETCQDRNIRQSLLLVEKLLNGRKITGMERFENNETR